MEFRRGLFRSAEVIYADPPVDEAPTGVIEASCYRQVEGAGILNGTDDEEAAGELIDFLLSETVQADVPMSMFVYPVRSGVELPAEIGRASCRGRVCRSG